MPKLCEGYAGRILVPAGSRDVQVFDDDLPGFGIRKFGSGKASYFVKFNIGAKQRRLTLGAVVKGNFAEMRKRASTVLAKARLGQDAVEEKLASIGEGKTLAELVPIYLEERRADLRARTHLEVSRHLKVHWKPLHPLRVKAVRREDIIRVIDDLVDCNGKGAADRARSALSTFFAWTIDRNFRDANPTLAIKSRGSNAGRNRVLSEAELVEVWQACLDDDYGRIVRLLILTLQRRTEIGDLADSELSYLESRILLSEHRTKNGRPHVIPLSGLACEILKSVERRKDRDLLFGQGIGGFSGWSKAKGDLDSRITDARRRRGIAHPMPHWTLHDLRRSGVTYLHELGLAQPHVVEAIVNHVSGHRQGVAGVYNKAQYLLERRQALSLWSDHLRNLINPRYAEESERSEAIVA